MSASTESKSLNRRQILKGSLTLAGGAAGLLGTSSALAQTFQAICQRTPAQPEGPFYPIQDQLDKDTDLTTVRGRPGRALGQVVYIEGQVIDENCTPISGVLVEIWQACASGRYNHPGDRENPAPLDPNFQYWGRALSDAEGRYLFKTIIPGHYPASSDWTRPAHIHYKVGKRGFRELITQMYFAGFPYNETDEIFQSLPRAEQETVVVELLPRRPEFEVNSKMCRFDITLRRP